MNVSVLLFFLHTVIATLLLGGTFVKRGGGVAKYFGIGLLLNALAFSAWGMGLLMPAQLLNLITFGAVAFLVSLVFFLRAGLDDMAPARRTPVLALGALAMVGVFVAGRYLYPNSGFISGEGFLFFNLHPVVQMLYLFALSLVVFPLIDKVVALFRDSQASLIRYCLIIEVVGGMILITSIDASALFMTGWAIGIAYFVLWSTILFKKDIWVAE